MADRPDIQDLQRVGTLFHPEVAALAADAEQAGLRPAAEDKPRVHLLLQIFHPAWWLDADGRHPEPFTVITREAVENGVWRPTLEAEWSRDYVLKLQQQAKKDLVVWPYHVPLGGLGSALDPELWSAVFWHSLARRSQPGLWTKGSNPKTEHYSILRPEVRVEDLPEADRTREFLGLFDEYEYILLAGEAETHCVLETVRDLVELLRGKPEKLSRVFILRDCMSPVRHPLIDFHALAVEAFKKYEKLGVQFITSSDPLPFVP